MSDCVFEYIFISIVYTKNATKHDAPYNFFIVIIDFTHLN